MSELLPKFTIKQLLQAGVHFGHRTMRRNPKMAKYVHSNRSGLSIIDLNKSAKKLQEALVAAHQVAKNNGRILFVGTKKQASPIVAEMAKKCGQYYANYRWLGGMLTNWNTVSKSIKTLRSIEAKLNDSESNLNKKEKLVLDRKREKLELALGGIKDMGGYPDLIFVIDINKEDIAIKEAVTLGIPIMAIVDTNCNPDAVKYAIPGNDDSSKAIKLYCSLLSDAIISGIKENMAASGVDVSNFDASKIKQGKEEVKSKYNVRKKEALSDSNRKPKESDSKVKSKKKVIVSDEKKTKKPTSKTSVETKKPQVKNPEVKESNEEVSEEKSKA